MRPSQFLSAVLAMSSVTVAMSDAFDNIHGMHEVKDVLFGRQDNNNNNNNNAQSSQQPSRTAAASSTPQPSQSQSNDDNNDNKNSASASGGSAKASGSQGGSRTSTGKPKATSFDPRLPAGGISMATPNPMAGQAFYKVGDWVTFAWNYTSLSVTPSYVDVLASCTANQATYTIAVNHTAADKTVLWNTKDTPTGQPPFLTEIYTLLIYDSNSTVSAAPQAGYLGAFNSLTFGMYTPQPYVSWQDYTCANCIKNSAFSHTETLTIKVMLLTSGTTIASLLYFAHNFGLW